MQTQSDEPAVEYIEYPVHKGRVSRLVLSADKQSLLSASAEGGALYSHSIKEMCNNIDMNLNVTLLASSKKFCRKRNSHHLLTNA